MAATGNRKGYPHRHNTMSVRVLLIVVVVAVMATACADPGTVTSTTLATTSTTEAQLDELTAARSRWDAAAPADYTVRSGEQLVAVHDGEVVSLGSPGAETVSVSRLPARGAMVLTWMLRLRPSTESVLESPSNPSLAAL